MSDGSVPSQLLLKPGQIILVDDPLKFNKLQSSNTSFKEMFLGPSPPLKIYGIIFSKLNSRNCVRHFITYGWKRMRLIDRAMLSKFVALNGFD